MSQPPPGAPLVEAALRMVFMKVAQSALGRVLLTTFVRLESRCGRRRFAALPLDVPKGLAFPARWLQCLRLRLELTIER